MTKPPSVSLLFENDGLSGACQPSSSPGTDRARNRLRSKGLRVTWQRLVLFQILEETSGHLDAESLLARARVYEPELCLATVYRTLARLKDKGLVTQRFLDQNRTRARYETTSKGAHFDFLYLDCGKVVEMAASVLEHASQELVRQFGVVLTGISLEGYCGGCGKGLGRTLDGSQARVRPADSARGEGVL